MIAASHLLLMEALMEEMEAEARLMPHTGAEYFRDRPADFPPKLEGKFADRIAFIPDLNLGWCHASRSMSRRYSCIKPAAVY